MTVALITGASSGLGAAAARRLAREPGMELVLVARRADLLEQLAGGAAAARDGARARPDRRGRSRAPATTSSAATAARLDLLVNNAGAGGRGTFAATGHALVRRTMELNFDAQVRLVEALPPPPRGARNRSACSSGVARTSSPAGVTDATHPHAYDNAGATAGSFKLVVARAAWPAHVRHASADGSRYGAPLPLSDRMRASRNAPRWLSLRTTSRSAARECCFATKRAVSGALLDASLAPG